MSIVDVVWTNDLNLEWCWSRSGQWTYVIIRNRNEPDREQRSQIDSQEWTYDAMRHTDDATRSVQPTADAIQWIRKIAIDRH